jgi:hypothetical protein
MPGRVIPYIQPGTIRATEKGVLSYGSHIGNSNSNSYLICGNSVRSSTRPTNGLQLTVLFNTSCWYILLTHIIRERSLRGSSFWFFFGARPDENFVESRG